MEPPPPLFTFTFMSVPFFNKEIVGYIHVFIETTFLTIFSSENGQFAGTKLYNPWYLIILQSTKMFPNSFKTFSFYQPPNHPHIKTKEMPKNPTFFIPDLLGELGKNIFLFPCN